jgi:hypothetical protein
MSINNLNLFQKKGSLLKVISPLHVCKPVPSHEMIVQKLHCSTSMSMRNNENFRSNLNCPHILKMIKVFLIKKKGQPINHFGDANQMYGLAILTL